MRPERVGGMVVEGIKADGPELVESLGMFLRNPIYAKGDAARSSSAGRRS